MNKIIQDTDIDSIKGEGIVLLGGCFDIIHPGHLEFIKKAKKEGNILIVLLESDKNVRKMKGEKRPLNNQIVRAENLSKIKEVDYVVMLKFPSDSFYYYNLVKLLHPAIIAVTKGDPLLSVKKDQARMVHGKVVEVMERNKSYSTTSIVENLL